MKVIRFRRLSRPDGPWEIAFDEDHLRDKLKGEIAEITMPAKSWYVRIWRWLRPAKGVEARLGREYTLTVQEKGQ